MKENRWLKRLSKYIAVFDYIDKALIVLSATSGGISIASFASVIGSPVGIASASLNFAFFLTTGIIKKLLKTLNEKKKHKMIVILARSKLSSIETLTSKALIDCIIAKNTLQSSMKKSNTKNKARYYNNEKSKK